MLFFFFLEGGGALCAPRGQSYSRLASLSPSLFIFILFFSLSPMIDLFSSSLAVACLL